MGKQTKINDLVGKTIKSIENKDNRYLQFSMSSGEVYSMYKQDGYYGNESSAVLEDIAGSLNDLIGNPILLAEERTNKNAPKVKNNQGEEIDFYNTQWTFYELATIKGSVTLRWYCYASLFYSDNVYFVQEK